MYLYDWNNAYSNNNTPLAKRFGEDFNKSFHLAKDEERGNTRILTISDKNYKFLKWERLKSQDIIKVQLNFPIYPNQKYELKLMYTTKLPNSKFTRYGYTKDKDFLLKHWYISPTVYENGEWKLYSNKNLDDIYNIQSDYNITFNYPKEYHLVTDLDIVERKKEKNQSQIILYGKNRIDVNIYVKNLKEFSIHKNNSSSILTNIDSKKLTEIQKGLSVDKVLTFVHENLGAYPHNKLLVTQEEYKNNPLYGLNQLPTFLRPFPNEFQFEMRMLKTTLINYLKNSIFMNPRTDKWVFDAIQTYLMVKYVEQYYPDMKLLGNLSKIWGVRSFSFAKMNFNDQYTFLYMLMARKSLDQELTQSRDSLIKFNEKIANKYKAGVGLLYLEKYLNDNSIKEKIKQFYNENTSKQTIPNTFIDLLKNNAAKNVDWFFDEYVQTRKKIDYKIQKLKKSKDSLHITIRNKRETNTPITLFGIGKRDTIISKQWFPDIKTEKSITLERKGIKRLVLNYDKVIPEFNQRNNTKSVSFFGNRKVKFQFFKDIEDPLYNQVFYVPVLTFNAYDGFTPGMRFYNKTFLTRPFLYDIRPSYSSGEKTLVGNGKVQFRKYNDDSKLYLLNFSLRGTTFHYAESLRYTKITPEVYAAFRPKDYRSNERQYLSSRYVSVMRDKSPEIATDPDYDVLNMRYIYHNNGIINYKSWFADLQISSKFSKIVFNWEYRKLFKNNRQLNLRVFAGKFIHNKTNSDFFSFALDRPTDYLFDYDYLGRSESTGLYSQQIIIAEGGFKSKLDYAFANDWMFTTNASMNLWKWVEVYGDIGFVDNKNKSTHFVYDSGIRLNLVTDYFELYFPIYSNNGWEITQPDYNEKIRFIITLSPKTLTGLFTRKWF